MPYDQYIFERITRILEFRKADFYSKNMMGGRVFMVDQKMLCGIHFDKKYHDHLLMARVGHEAALIELAKPQVEPMMFTGKNMKDYIFILSSGYDSDEDLEYWIDKCLAFNPLAKSSKKK